MWPPSLFEDKSQTEQLALAVGGPILFGIIAGVLVGASEALYLLWSLIALVGMVLAGFEHTRRSDAALRGIAAGLLYGAFILLTKRITGSDAKADLPDPEGVLVALTVAFSVVAGVGGAALRRRRMPLPDSPAPTR